jgi:hypothetical protein
MLVTQHLPNDLLDRHPAATSHRACASRTLWSRLRSRSSPRRRRIGVPAILATLRTADELADALA